MEWKKVVFGLAVCLLYIPMVFMAVNTFFPKTPENTCYLSYPYKYGAPENLTYEQQQARDEEMRLCDSKYQEERTRYDGWKFIIIMIINIIASAVLLINLDKSIRYGLFFGIVIAAFAGTMGYMESRSAVGFGLLVVLFIFVVYLINSWKKE
ncbi:MAG: hypothetical protein HGA85_05045 [Nanoarchaeota archaeon]|nr:hypothetical protein [Nanoarchaeota archaeon]